MKNIFKYLILLSLLLLSRNTIGATEETYIVTSACPHSIIPLNPALRQSSYPYISGDAFREACNFIIDETKIPFNPQAVKDGDTIFLNGDYLDYFFSTIHEKIKAHYVLVTHNSDYDIPGKFASYLNDETLAGWFGQNVILKHPKIFPLPIGLANKCWQHGNPDIITKALHSFGNKAHKKKLLYMNFSITHPDRRVVYALFLNKSFCTVHKLQHNVQHGGSDPYTHLKDLVHHKFVLSPRGNGLDTHRTWETLLMGSIPVVQTSASDSMYDDLPVLIINNWQEVTEQLLQERYNLFISKNYNVNKLYAPYWIDQISALQAKIRNRSIPL